MKNLIFVGYLLMYLTRILYHYLDLVTDLFMCKYVYMKSIKRKDWVPIFALMCILLAMERYSSFKLLFDIYKKKYESEKKDIKIEIKNT